MNLGAWSIGPVVTAMLLGACAKGQATETAPPRELAEADYPGALATTLTGPDFMARQRLRGTARGREIGGEVVLQKQGDALTLIGLTPFSTKAFVAKQQGAEVKVDVFAPEGKLPFPPRFMLLDVHRVQFLGLPGAPLADGTHRGEVGEEKVTEVWQGGALLERRFERKDGKPGGEIVVTYEGGMKDGALPSRLRLVNGWFGYEIAVETLQWQPL
ncbi:DUF3261 domain-containing protein [Nannocystis pusilla]|uniref:DUF3261 domain-containing protein n=1 Tax=Nannocystis pusilla TaxID=889268 RepID=UPI003BF2A981